MSEADRSSHSRGQTPGQNALVLLLAITLRTPILAISQIIPFHTPISGDINGNQVSVIRFTFCLWYIIIWFNAINRGREGALLDVPEVKLELPN